MAYIKLPPTVGGGGTSDDITNLSTTPGATVTDALNNTNTTVNNIEIIQQTTQYVPENPFTLTATDITNKYIILSSAPVTKEVSQLFVVGAGAPMTYGTDFEVTADDGGKRLSWNGLALEAILAENDTLIVLHN